MPKVEQLKMLVWTFIAVVVMGIGVSFSLLTPPKSVTIARNKSRTEKVALVESSDRSPASAQPQFSALAIDDNGQQALDFTLSCDMQFSRFAANVAQVRLTGESCLPQAKQLRKPASRQFASSDIRNEANGFSATVFYPREARFTTDYITLSHGENRISIRHIFSDGAREERDYVIDRSH